jgi:7-cyano-7-deazaguanine reductase
MEEKIKTLEELYGLKQNPVSLSRVRTISGKYLEVFNSPGAVKIVVDFPEFTCLCPKTSQPDFATVILKYIPDKWCVEFKSLKYYLNSFRNEGHFHEEMTLLMYNDLKTVLGPRKLFLLGEFNVRGGTYPTISAGEDF